MNYKSLPVRSSLVILVFGILFCLSGSAFAIPTLCCTDTGDCCNASAWNLCDDHCGSEYENSGVGLCSIFPLPCLFRGARGCEQGWDPKCCTAAGGTPTACSAMERTEEVQPEGTNELEADAGAPVGLIAILLSLLAIPLVAMRLASRR